MIVKFSNWQLALVIGGIRHVVCLLSGVGGKVLKPRPDRMVRSGKPRTTHFYGSFSLKN